MKYDDSEYYFLNFETALDNHAANTHVGMYLAWAVHAGLARDDAQDEGWAQATAATRARQLTGANLLSDLCDGKLTDMEFNAEGNDFTSSYYGGGFHKDYARVFDSQIPSTGHDADDICSVPDTWDNFDLLKPVLDRRLAQWRSDRQGGGLSLEPISGAPATPAPQADAGPAPDMAALRTRAERGDRDAWYALAVEYISGAHVPRDFVQAANAFEKAAQAGIPEAAFNLGVCYQNGDGRPQDAKQRLRWFALAAEGGHGEATYFLAQAYRQGEQVPQDFVASNALMLLAQRRGVEEARSAGVMAGSLAESLALAEQLSQPGQLVALLSARRRKVMAGQADSGVERWKHGHAAAARSAGRDAEGQEPAREAGGFGLGHVALLIGAAAAVLLLLAGLTGPRFVWLAWALSFVGAGGAFAVGPSLGLHGAVRIVVTALAALPVLGSFINMWLVVRWAGRRSR